MILSFQGAEATIAGRENYIIKDRIKKSYRHPIIDLSLRKKRTKKEVKLLKKASNFIPVPFIKKNDDCTIELEKIEGKKLSECLDRLKNKKEISYHIGKNISLLHDNSIIHGDLTTSNMIYSKDKVYFIDFGLGFESQKIEDKATDLKLLQQALEAKHHKYAKKLFSYVIEGYRNSIKSNEVLTRLNKVQRRGRYKKSY